MRPYRTGFALCAVFAALASWVPVAGAQSGQDPADPAAQVPPASYRSAFSGYRPMGEEPVADWRASNAEVGRIGGWRAYAREAQAPDEKSMPHAGAKEQQAPVQGGHTGHGSHAMPGAPK